MSTAILGIRSIGDNPVTWCRWIALSFTSRRRLFNVVTMCTFLPFCPTTQFRLMKRCTTSCWPRCAPGWTVWDYRNTRPWRRSSAPARWETGEPRSEPLWNFGMTSRYKLFVPASFCYKNLSPCHTVCVSCLYTASVAQSKANERSSCEVQMRREMR